MKMPELRFVHLLVALLVLGPIGFSAGCGGGPETETAPDQQAQEQEDLDAFYGGDAGADEGAGGP